MGNAIVVEGYSFADENMANQARKEIEGVKYVKAKTDMSKPEEVLRVYHRLLEQKMFQTPVGYAYLKELQDYLKAMPGTQGEEIKPIPIAPNLVVNDSLGLSGRLRAKAAKERGKFKVSLFINFVLIVSIFLIYILTVTSGRTTILNYEQKIQDRYAQWEQTLTEREKAIREEEQDLELEFDTYYDDADGFDDMDLP